MSEITFSSLLGMAARHDELVRKKSRLDELILGLAMLKGDDFNDACPSLSVRVSPGIGALLGVDLEIRYDVDSRSGLISILRVLSKELGQITDRLQEEISRHGNLISRPGRGPETVVRDAGPGEDPLS